MINDKPFDSVCSRRFLWKGLLFIICYLSFSHVVAQQHFPKQIPAGNYSGICPIGNDRYAVVSDKSGEDGFFVFHLVTDSVRGRILSAANEGFRSSGQPNCDMEGICYFPVANTLFISNEQYNEVNEYALDGQRTGRCLAMPEVFKKAKKNLGLESLTYDTLSHRFYTTTEQPLPGDTLLRIQAFNDSLQPTCQYLYMPDKPLSKKHFHGVSALCALGDGRLLVLERQLKIPKLKIGATTVIRLYETKPSTDVHLEKRLLKEFKTRINLFSRKFANYEGLCPTGNGWLLLVADSQNRYRGVLRDWFLHLFAP